MVVFMNKCVPKPQTKCALIIFLAGLSGKVYYKQFSYAIITKLQEVNSPMQTGGRLPNVKLFSKR